MAKKPYPSELADRYIVRMPPGMRDRIADSAKRYNRSMNAEIVSILEDYYNLRDYHDQLIDDAIEQTPAPVTAASAIESLSGPALEQLAELLSRSVADKLSHRLGEQLRGDTADAKPPRVKRTASKPR